MTTPPCPPWRCAARSSRPRCATGIHRLISREEVINKINVFPVPDGDTGHEPRADAAGGARGAARRARAARRPAADARRGRRARRRARQLRRDPRAVPARRRRPRGDQADAHGGGVRGCGRRPARPMRANRSPSRARARSSPCSRISPRPRRPRSREGGRDFRALFREALAAARASLEATRDQLEMLRRANVVDAGALGFVELVAGMAEYLETGVAPADDAAIQLLPTTRRRPARRRTSSTATAPSARSPAMRIDRRKLREEASGARLEPRRRRHAQQGAAAHPPERAAAAVRARRALRRGHRREGRRHAAAAGDGAPRGAAAGRGGHRFRGRPAGVGARGARHPRGAGARALRHAELPRQGRACRRRSSSASWRRVRCIPKTSQPPPGDFRRAFEFLGSHYEAVVYVGLMARVSGTFQSAETAASRARTRARS